MHIRTFLKPFSFLPAILLMYMIFSFSAQEADVSSAVSYKASCYIVEAADTILDMGLEDHQVSYFATKIENVTRKLAHMCEYFLLAVAVSFPLYVYGLHGIFLILVAGLFCVAFACGDEYHQSFVAGRSPSMRDVGIDSFGILIGIILVRIIGWTGRKTIFRPIVNKGDKKLSREEKKRLQTMRDETSAGNVFQERPGYTPDPSYYYDCNAGHSANYGQPNLSYNNYQNAYQAPYNPYAPQKAAWQKQNPGSSQKESQPYQQSPYNGSPQYYKQPYPYQPQTPQYMGKEDEYSSDELSDDMPFSHLLKPKH